MPANLPTDKKIVEFVVMREDFTPNEAGVIKGLNFLTAELFEDTIAEALSQTVEINMDWCNVVSRRYITKHGICVVAINYGYPEGAELFRSNICAQSDAKTMFNTYPAADLLKKYAVTVFFHSASKEEVTTSKGILKSSTAEHWWETAANTAGYSHSVVLQTFLPG